LNISKNTLKALAKLEFEADVTLIEDRAAPDGGAGFTIEVHAGTSARVVANVTIKK
jgi:hypothetical protein